MLEPAPVGVKHRNVRGWAKFKEYIIHMVPVKAVRKVSGGSRQQRGA